MDLACWCIALFVCSKSLLFSKIPIYEEYVNGTKYVEWSQLVVRKKKKKEIKRRTNLDDWLTVQRSITLIDFQLDAQNSYLFTYNTFIKILYMFRALPCSS
jgi:hypothetical protein